MMKFLEVADLFKDCWKLYRKYYGHRMSEALWEQCLQERSALYQKYQTPMARELISAVISELERMIGDGG